MIGKLITAEPGRVPNGVAWVASSIPGALQLQRLIVGCPGERPEVAVISNHAHGFLQWHQLSSRDETRPNR